MYVLVYKDNGEFYSSPVFGFYNDSTEQYNHEMYYIILDENHENLIKKYAYDQDSKILSKDVIVLDPDQTDWIMTDSYHGGVNFLPKENALNYIDTGTPSEILDKCRSLVQHRDFLSLNIETENDIEKIMYIAGDFHDGYIKAITSSEPDTLSVYFAGIWGCDLKMILSGNVRYKALTHDQEWEETGLDPHWYEATMRVEDGTKCLVNGELYGNEKVEDAYCWFKADNMQFRIIPHGTNVKE